MRMNLLKGLFSSLKTTSFLIMLCITLATTTVSLAVWTASLATQVTTMTVSAAAALIQNRNALAAAVARTRASMTLTHKKATTALKTRMTVQRKKAVGSAVARTKAKARLRRVMAAVPLAGIAAAGYFEHSDYQEWKEDNPEGDFAGYSCEVSALSAEVIDEVLQELPETVRPGRDLVLSQLPTCSKSPQDL